MNENISAAVPRLIRDAVKNTITVLEGPYPHPLHPGVAIAEVLGTAEFFPPAVGTFFSFVRDGEANADEHLFGDVHVVTGSNDEKGYMTYRSLVDDAPEDDDQVEFYQNAKHRFSNGHHQLYAICKLAEASHEPTLTDYAIEYAAQHSDLPYDQAKAEIFAALEAGKGKQRQLPVRLHNSMTFDRAVEKMLTAQRSERCGKKRFDAGLQSSYTKANGDVVVRKSSAVGKSEFLAAALSLTAPV